MVLDLNLKWPWGDRAFPPVAAPFPPSSMLGGELSVLRVVLVGHPAPSPETYGNNIINIELGGAGGLAVNLPWWWRPRVVFVGRIAVEVL